MGAFDDNQANRSYNDAIPEPEEDGVYAFPATKDICKDCIYRSYVKNGTADDPDCCAWEACIVKNGFVGKWHKDLSIKCDICNQQFPVHMDNIALVWRVCPTCMEKLREVILGDLNGQQR